MNTLLEIENLSISFIQYYKGLKQRTIEPVKNLNLSVHKGEIHAIVGASGSGKSLLAHAILGLLPSNARVNGTIHYKGILLTEQIIKTLRGKAIRFIPQSVTYLDPTRKVGKQLYECFEKPTKHDVIQLLQEFDLSPEVYDYYPSQLSGGMLRRILFATCKGYNTELIIADEPTPGIHPQALTELMNQLISLRDQGISIIFITHDMKSALSIADKISIFKDGMVIETTTPAQILKNAKENNPYTLKLWNAQAANKFWEAQ